MSTVWLFYSILLGLFVVGYSKSHKSLYKISEVTDNCGGVIKVDNHPAGRLIYSNSKPKQCSFVLQNDDIDKYFQLRFINDDIRCPNWIDIYDGNSTSDDILTSTDCDKPLPKQFKSSDGSLLFSLEQTNYDSTNLMIMWTVITKGHQCNSSLDSADYMCRDQVTCISRSLVCDNWDNCPDDSDESSHWANCPEKYGGFDVWMIVLGAIGALCLLFVIAAAIVCACRRQREYYRVK